MPANTGRWTSVGSMLGHRLRRWPNIEPTLVRPVFAGMSLSIPLTYYTSIVVAYFIISGHLLSCILAGLRWYFWTSGRYECCTLLKADYFAVQVTVMAEVSLYAHKIVLDPPHLFTVAFATFILLQGQVQIIPALQG